jgi:hypothetical protein
MRIVSTLAVAIIAAAGFLGTARAEEAKEVTLKGTQQCAKCSLKLEGIKECQDVLTVKDGDKTINYFLVKGEVKHQCQGTKADVELKGTVSEKDGHTWLKISAPNAAK